MLRNPYSARVERSPWTTWFAVAVAALSLLASSASAQPDVLPARQGLQQWLNWEQQANTARFRRPPEMQISLVRVPRENLTIEMSADLPRAVRDRFLRGDYVIYPQHPHNRSSLVPYRDLPVAETWTVAPTASRSVADLVNLFTIKLPTDRPHGPDNLAQPTKANVAEDLDVGMLRSEHISRAERLAGRMESGVLLREILTVRDNRTRNGFLVRDLRELRPNHYYLPAFSIPYVGREIAQRHGEDFLSFWTRHDAEVYGRLKAQVLTRYGLWFETPNAQNRLIELDQNLMPTGRILLRDVSDTFLHEGICRALGFDDILAAEPRGWSPTRSIQPKGYNSYWQMDDGTGVSSSDVQRLINAHEEAYASELSRELGVEVRRGDWGTISEEALVNLRRNHEQRQLDHRRRQRSLRSRLRLTSPNRYRLHPPHRHRLHPQSRHPVNPHHRHRINAHHRHHGRSTVPVRSPRILR